MSTVTRPHFPEQGSNLHRKGNISSYGGNCTAEIFSKLKVIKKRLWPTAASEGLHGLARVAIEEQAASNNEHSDVIGKVAAWRLRKTI